MGMATDAKLIVLKVLNEHGDGDSDIVIEAMKWLCDNRSRYSIRVVNLSFGMNISESEKSKRLNLAVESLWNCGMTVVASAGNNGPKTDSITLPGSNRKVITVGACCDKRGDSAVKYSGRGSENGSFIKPDIVAPANDIMSCSCGKTCGYSANTGTSMATSVVSGAICLLLEKYPYLSNNDVKMRLRARADDLGQEHIRQGWGKLNVEKLLG